MTVAADDEYDLPVGFDTADATVSVASHIVDEGQIGPMPHLVAAKIESAYVSVRMIYAEDTVAVCVCPCFVRHNHGILESRDTSFDRDENVGWCQPSILRIEERFELAVVAHS